MMKCRFYVKPNEFCLNWHFAQVDCWFTQNWTQMLHLSASAWFAIDSANCRRRIDRRSLSEASKNWWLHEFEMSTRLIFLPLNRIWPSEMENANQRAWSNYIINMLIIAMGINCGHKKTATAPKEAQWTHASTELNLDMRLNREISLNKSNQSKILIVYLTEKCCTGQQRTYYYLQAIFK